jgi:hypothetical protein
MSCASSDESRRFGILVIWCASIGPPVMGHGVSSLNSKGNPFFAKSSGVRSRLASIE